MLPEARRDGLVVQEVGDEMVLYDLAGERGHTLNRVAALVWRQCDGRTSVEGIARSLHDELDQPEDIRIVLAAIKQLDRAGLMKRESVGKSPAGLCRRALLATGLRVLMLPSVMSLSARVAQARNARAARARSGAGYYYAICAGQTSLCSAHDCAVPYVCMTGTKVCYCAHLTVDP